MLTHAVKYDNEKYIRHLLFTSKQYSIYNTKKNINKEYLI